MANFLTISSQFIIFLTSFLILSISTTTETQDVDFVEAMDRDQLGLTEEKLSHFKLYWHDVVSGPNPTGAQILPALNGSKTFFGSVRIIDNPLTMGPDLGSKMVGRAQGMYALASQEEVGLMMAMNFAFSEGKYNGSSIIVMGRNPVFSAAREMPVVGGSGLFRFARGYVQLRTHMFDTSTGDATVEYSVCVTFLNSLQFLLPGK